MKLNRTNFFYYGLLLFAAVFPFSVALISISAAMLLLFSIVSFESEKLKRELNDRKYLLFFWAIYLLHALGMLFCKDLAEGLYDLKKALPFLLVPLAFLFAPVLSALQFRNVLQTFFWAVFLSALIVLSKFYWTKDQLILDAQFAGYIHHIRFSLMILLALSIQVYLLVTSAVKQSLFHKIAAIAAIFFLIYFLFWQQSLTGLITFFLLLFFSLFILLLRNKSLKLRIVGAVILLLVIGLPTIYLYRVIDDFYNVDEINEQQLPVETALGNPYHHDFSNPFTENGHFVGLYVCEIELREAWNNRSDLDYDGIDENGYRVSDTLIRYMTSRNLPKDAEGMAQLSDDEVELVESGVSNYRLDTRSLSLYPRVYTSVWEVDNYLKTGNANHKSIAQRIEYGKAAWVIWQENFWFGIGTGNWKAAYRQVFRDMGFEKAEDQYGEAHNQYLAWLVRFGLVGMVLILVLFYWPAIHINSLQYPLFLAFLFILTVSNFGDSNLDTHVGGYFFLLFYCLFFANRKYLKTSL